MVESRDIRSGLGVGIHRKDAYEIMEDVQVEVVISVHGMAHDRSMESDYDKCELSNARG